MRTRQKDRKFASNWRHGTVVNAEESGPILKSGEGRTIRSGHPCLRAEQQQFLEQRGWAGIPVGLDTNQKIGDQFEVQGIPHTVVIDKEGKVAWVHSGYKEGMGDDLEKAIEKALAGPGGPEPADGAEAPESDPGRAIPGANPLEIDLPVPPQIEPVPQVN